MSDYLIRFGNEWFPHDLLAEDGYSVTPNRRTELEAFRDADIELHRVTSPNFKTSITLTTCPMCRSDKERLQRIINAAGSMINETERKVSVTYWNEEENTYKTGMFYMTDPTYAVRGYFGGERWYKPITYELIEY